LKTGAPGRYKEYSKNKIYAAELKEKATIKPKERVAIVTGGGTGIRKAISLAFADEGAAIENRMENANINRELSSCFAQGTQSKSTTWLPVCVLSK
jgi:hypothetical protein